MERSVSTRPNGLLPHRPVVSEVLRTPAQPLDQRTRGFMEARFGHDFSRVRVHHDVHAAEAADAVGAHAFTVGNDLVFGAAQFAPDTHAGKRLLAHELGHVVQQENGAPRRIQRTAKFTKGKPKEAVNPAEQIAENKIKDVDLYFGRTNFFLNGTNFTGQSTTKMNDALKKPTVAYNSITIPLGGSSAQGSGSGSGATQKTIPGFECSFDSVPDNQGTNEVKVLKADPWTHVTAKKNVAGRFSSLKACEKGLGDVTFVLKGDPDAKTVRDKVKAHEQIHADDNEKIFNDLVGNWDTAITTAFKSKSTVKATTQRICEKALYAFSGKSHYPDDLVTNLSGQINKAGEDFHKKAAGARPTTKPEKPDSDCNVVKARTGY